MKQPGDPGAPKQDKENPQSLKDHVSPKYRY